MTKLSLTLLKSVGCALALTMSACTVTPPTSAVESVAQDAALTLDLKKGQVLQLALVRSKEGQEAQDVRARYFETAIPFAESLGDEYLGNLKIEKTFIGENDPKGIAIYAFPDEAAQAAFQNTPDWPEYQKMRREGWDELHVFSTTIEKDMVLKFDAEKDYTLAAAWTRDGTFSDYQKYLDGIETDFDQIGARFVVQLNNVTLQSQTDDGGNPSQLTIVEWSDGPNLPGLQQTEGYKTHSKYFQNAISRFDFYWLKVTKDG